MSEGGHSSSDTTTLNGGGDGGVGGSGGSEEDLEVVETMKEMLHQLSLHPSSSNNHIAMGNPSNSNSTNFTEWAKSPPKKPVEMFDEL